MYVQLRNLIPCILGQNHEKKGVENEIKERNKIQS